MRRDKRIVLTRPDLERLRGILGSRNGSPRDREHFLDLREEIDRARIVGAEEVTPVVVTLQSEVRVRDSETGIPSDYTVVSPAHADVRSGHVSVLAPLGTALLGYREGDEVEWQMPGGVRRLQIERVRQPRRIAAVPREYEVSAHSAHVTA
jgi:regulator of nucleoside diphosphate kinase